MQATFNKLKELTSAHIARQIIMQYFSYSLLEYSLASSRTLAKSDSENLIKIAQAYSAGEPLQYIFGKTYIKDLEFACEKGVLIPRSDTEILIDKAIAYIDEFDIKNVLEIGFGSGIISIFLALHTKAKITACDINEKALNLALKNAARYLSHTNSMFKIADFMTLDFSGFDLVISNPPYISAGYKLDKSVLSEPASALIGGEKGYEILEQIIKKSALFNVPHIACEFGYDQKEFLSSCLKAHGYKARFFKDLAGFDRVFLARKEENEKI